MTFSPGRILVPLDGSKLAESVLPSTYGLARAFGVPLILLHVLERRPPRTVHGQPHLGSVPEALEYLDQLARHGRELGLEVAVHAHPEGVTDVAGAIAEHAREMDAELIALCTHGSGGVKSLLLGSIAQQTLRRGFASVLLVRPAAQGGEERSSCQEITVAFDPQVHGEAALAAAMQVARACDGRVHLVTVVPTTDSLPPRRRAARTLLPRAMRAVLDLEDRQARREIGDARRTLSEAGIAGTSEVLRGDPVPRIAESLDQRRVDLLVVATHGRSGLGGWMEGSFAPRITSLVRVPILLVRVA